MNDLVQKVKNWLKENGIGRDCGIVIGVSGGADSLCLLTVLQEAAKENALRLFAVHVHHGIRGAEADRDAEYVKKLCEGMQIPFFLEKGMFLPWQGSGERPWKRQEEGFAMKFSKQ